MGLRRHTLRPRKQLEIRVNIVAAKDLVDMANASGCIMVAQCAFNRQRRRTRKVKRTVGPVWNSTVKLSLSPNDNSDVIHLAVFDRHRKYSLYLGEIRFSVIELFKDSPRVEAVWYRLHSSKSQNKFVTGSIKVGFELVSKGDVKEAFHSWGLLAQHHKIKLDEQWYYPDTETDVDSLASDEEDEELLKADSHGLAKKFSSMTNLTVPTYLHSVDNTDGSEMSELSDHIPDTESRKVVHPNTVIGVITLNIEEAEGLPPFKGFMNKSFDMDPFVVISFGKKTFRTSWRKHTLNPVFNQKLVFEVISNETNFDIVFTVMDKDHISFHDKVAMGSIPVGEFIDGKKKEFNLELTMHRKMDGYRPHLKLTLEFKPYSQLKREMWNVVLDKYGPNLDLLSLEQFLVVSGIDEDSSQFFYLNNKNIDNTLSVPEIVKVLKGKNMCLKRCPICLKSSAFDFVTHIAICSQSDKLKSFATTGLATKRWYSKMLIKVAYGRYALGKNNANILVQDRVTGFILEEKMALYIRLGIRLFYKGTGADTKRIKNVLRNKSFKQGAKFDAPASVKYIEPFKKFYKLDISECLDADYKTFNEFFYRKLKSDARPLESTDSRVAVSPADCRATTFQDLESAQRLWIKGKCFSIRKLLGNAYTDKFEQCSIGIFRLAPQDYHRFHCPVDGVIMEPTYIDGEYYTVNPMAVRSHLDVYGENIRVVVPIETDSFGLVMFIAVGAMMVGSTVLTVKPGDHVERGEELGYFKFGGSTCLVLFQKGTIKFDSDLLQNSTETIETLVRVGMSIGHTPNTNEVKRQKKKFQDEPEEEQLKIIRTITGGGDAKHSWEFYNLETESDAEIDYIEDEDEDYEL